MSVEDFIALALDEIEKKIWVWIIPDLTVGRILFLNPA
jgi:hypothetical protein